MGIRKARLTDASEAHTLSPMYHCRTGPRARMRLTAVAIPLMAATVWPTAVLAADPVVETQNSAVVVFVVIVLLFGSLTAGLIFASPLRRHLVPALDSLPEDPAADGFNTDHETELRAPRLSEPLPQAPEPHDAWPPPGRTAAPPTITQQWPDAEPGPPATAQPPTNAQLPSAVRPEPPTRPRPAAAAWSTNRPQADANWNPGSRRTP